MVTVGIIEDDYLLRLTYEEALRQFGAEIAFSFSSIEEMKEKEKTIEAPFLILLDIGLPGISGLDGIYLLSKMFPDAHLLVISGNTDEKAIWSAITRGAKGYLIKPIKLESLKQQIDIIIDGGALIAPEVATLLLKKVQLEKIELNKKYADLTPRESEVLNYLMKGFTYKEVAVKMDISVSTVNDFIKKVYKKMDVHSKSELLSLYL